MKILLAGTTALLLTAMPAQAQILGGGGGLGGMIGGAIGGGGSIGSMDMPGDTIRSVTRGTLDGSARTSGSKSVDRKRGTVRAERSAEANGSGDLSQTVSGPMRSVSGGASGNAGASGSGSADAQLIGTDAIGALAGQASGTARGAANAVSQRGQAAASGAGRASGNAQGAGSGMFSGAAGQLAAAGSLAAAGQGSFAIDKGMPILAPDGDRIGKVREILTDGRGRVRELLVKVDGETARLPAANFTGTGSVLVSAMTEGQIKREADRQDDARKASE